MFQYRILLFFWVAFFEESFPLVSQKRWSPFFRSHYLRWMHDAFSLMKNIVAGRTAAWGDCLDGSFWYDTTLQLCIS